MPTVALDKQVIYQIIGEKLSDTALKEKIAMIGTDLESVDEKKINVEIFPNRPDWLSEQGFARSFSAFLGKKTGLPKYHVKKSGYAVLVDTSVTMRPYTACAIVKNLRFTDERIREVMQMQEKLATTHGRNRKKSAYGVYPSKKIAFPIQYTAKDPSKVLFHALGLDKPLPASQVEEIHPKAKEYKEVAKGWKKYPFFIDNKNNVMCMLPYTNSDDTGKIDETTNEVFIECTGISLDNVSVALNIFVTMLADMDGEIYSIDIKYPDKTITTPDLTPKQIVLDINYANKRLGLDLPEQEIKNLLERMNYGYQNGGDHKGTVLIPPYRADILHQVDIIEDIAIAYGYENIEEELPSEATIAKEDEFEVFKKKIAELLIGLGFFETSSYHLIDHEFQTTAMNISKDKAGHIVSVIDPVSLGYNSLRSMMLPSLLHILQQNCHNEYPQNMFEIGTTFKKDAGAEAKVTEESHLGVVLCHQTADFTKIKQVYQYLLQMLGLERESSIEEDNHPSFIQGRVGCWRIAGIQLCTLGELHPSVISQFGVEMPTVALELNMTELWKLHRKIAYKKGG